MIALFTKAIVAIVLLITIVYCLLLDRRLRRRRAEEQPAGAPAGSIKTADGTVAVRIVRPLRRSKSTLTKFDATQAQSRRMESL